MVKYKKGSYVRLLKTVSGNKIGSTGIAVSDENAGILVITTERSQEMIVSLDSVEPLHIPKKGETVKCRPGLSKGTAGAGYADSQEFVVREVRFLDSPQPCAFPEGGGAGVYLHGLELSQSKKVEKVTIRPFERQTLTKHDILGQDKITKQIELAANKNIPTLIIGDTGSGKTTIVKSVADKQERKYTRFNLTGETTVDEFVGKYVLRDKNTVWEDGVLLAAMKAGHWLIVDEINVALPEILFVLHSLLDDDRSVLVANHNGEVVKPHRNFRFFGTMNPVDEYAGTKDLNKAFKSRFGMILNMNYPEAQIEAQVVSAKGNTNPEIAMQIVDVGQVVRQAKKAGDCFYTCSTRDLIQWATLVDDLGLQDSFEVSVLNKANGDREVVQKAYEQVVGGYKQAKKDGHNLNLDEIVAMNIQLEAEKKRVHKRSVAIRKEVKADLLKSLIDKGQDKDLKALIQGA